MLSGIFRKSTKDLHGLLREYPPEASAYELLEDCGKGVSATVYRAYCKPLDEVVAVKKMNLESIHSNLDEIVHEAQLMKNYHHPNVLPLHTSFVDGSDLWMVMPFISGGSVLHIMKYAHPEGLEELAISTIMRDVLKALDYVHRQGGIHRDIKAGNILVDKDGCVKLADFGVATTMDRTGSWGHDKGMRMTFVGTPCWMAPEVMEQTAGYDNAADIWSFGIAMLEMAHGAAPFAKYPPMKVLLMTLQNPPPSLEDKGKKHFSKAMRDVVTRCLQKDPRSRPTAAHLLEHKFFKQAKDEEYLAKHLMAGLPSLGDRVQQIRQGKAATLGAENERNCARSQEEYKKGVSSWNFDVAALKAAADLEHDDDAMMLPTIREDDAPGEEALTLSGPPAVSLAAMVAGANGPPPPAPSGPPAALPAVGSMTSIASSFSTAVENGMAAAGSSTADLGLGADRPSSESWSAWACSSPDVVSRAESREQSSVSLAAGSSGAIKQAARTKGRFSVYSESDPVPPMSPSAPPQGMALHVPDVAEPAPAPAPGSHPGSEVSTPLLSPTASVHPPPPAPPAQLPACTVAAPAASGSAAREGDPPTPRKSEDGLRREDTSYAEVVASGPAAAATSTAALSPTAPAPAAAPTLTPVSSVAAMTTTSAPAADGEAKKKGRFTVIENNTALGSGPGLERKPSHQALDPHHMSGSRGDLSASSSSAALTGASRGGGGGGSGGVPPVTAVLPRLQELLDHNAQQQAALTRLLVAVKDSDASGRGLSALLQPGRHLFEPSSGGGGGSGGGAGPFAHPHAPADPEMLEELRHSVRTLQSRLSIAEAENSRLRMRNAALEASLGPSSISRKGSRREVADAEPVNGVAQSPLLSPRSARSPRVSEEGSHA